MPRNRCVPVQHRYRLVHGRGFSRVVGECMGGLQGGHQGGDSVDGISESRWGVLDGMELELGYAGSGQVSALRRWTVDGS